MFHRNDGVLGALVSLPLLLGVCVRGLSGCLSPEDRHVSSGDRAGGCLIAGSLSARGWLYVPIQICSPSLPSPQPSPLFFWPLSLAGFCRWIHLFLGPLWGRWAAMLHLLSFHLSGTSLSTPAHPCPLRSVLWVFMCFAPLLSPARGTVFSSPCHCRPPGLSLPDLLSLLTLTFSLTCHFTLLLFIVSSWLLSVPNHG